MRRTTLVLALTACMSAFMFAPIAHAGNSKAKIKVNCSPPGAHGKIANVLGRLDPADRNVVYVSGYCVENVVIQGFDDLTLIAEHGATIQDASGAQQGVSTVVVRDSKRVVIQGFTIVGGYFGLSCSDFSYCRFIDNTVTGTVGNGAISFGNSLGRLTNVAVQDNTGVGINLFHSRVVVDPPLTISNVHAGSDQPGVGPGTGLVLENSTFAGGPVTIQNAAGSGIQAMQSSHLHLGLPASITGSGLDGIDVTTGSSATISSVTVTGSGGDGVRVMQGANVEMSDAAITGNGGRGIFVAYASTANILGGEISNHPAAGVHVSDESTLGIWNATVTHNNDFGLFVGTLSSAFVIGGAFIENNQNGAAYGFDIACQGPQGFVSFFENPTVGTTNCPTSAAAPGKSLKQPSQPKPPGILPD